MRRIEKLIKMRSKKYIEVARMLSISKQSFHSKCKAFDRGVLHFNREELKKICVFLNVSPGSLMELFLED
ncbi:MAG: helix-turn-helix domain-containing protein [Fusobacteriaceae bacterium]